jgi:hypothetical protein
MERYKIATARAFGLPDNATPSEINTAHQGDTRTKNQQAATMIAEYRRLGAEAGIDPGDSMRYGPPDKGGRKPLPSHWQELTTKQDQQLEGLLARGWDYLDAYAEVKGVDPDTLRMQQAGGIVDKRAGETTTQALRRSYDEWVHLRYLEAEQATAGNVLNKAGQARANAGELSAVELFSGPLSTARKYASEELLRHWTERPRLTFQQFRAQITGNAKDKAAGALTARGAQGKDFG